MKICSKSSIRKLSPKTEAVIIFLSFFITATLFILSLFVGAANITARDTWQWLSGGEVGGQIHNIMLHVRLPRSLAALICGTALLAARMNVLSLGDEVAA